jgi:hypothetical protein
MWWIGISRRKRLPQRLDLVLGVLFGKWKPFFRSRSDIVTAVRSNPADAAAALVLFPSLL